MRQAAISSLAFFDREFVVHYTIHDPRHNAPGIRYTASKDRYSRHRMKEVGMMGIRAKRLLLAVAVVCTVATLAAAQTPLPPEGTGTVIAVEADGKATVLLKEKEQTVQLPGAKVGDKAACKVQNEKLACTLQPK